jgi:hypothetical protein
MDGARFPGMDWFFGLGIDVHVQQFPIREPTINKPKGMGKDLNELELDVELIPLDIQFPVLDSWRLLTGQVRIPTL